MAILGFFIICLTHGAVSNALEWKPTDWQWWITLALFLGGAILVGVGS